MGEAETLENLFHERNLRQPVVGDSPVGKNVLESREGVERDLLCALSAIGCHECRNEHVAARGVHAAVLRVEGGTSDARALKEACGGILLADVLRLQTLGNNGDVVDELVECVAVITVVGIVSAQGGLDGDVRLGVTTAIDVAHVVVHELNLAGAVVGAVAGEVDFEALDGFQLHLGGELIGLGEQCRRGLRLIGKQPSAALGF